MKKTIVVTSVMLTLLFSCTVQEEDRTFENTVLTTRIEQGDTRASFAGTAGNKLTWDAGDQIAVRVGSAYVTKTVTTESGSDGTVGSISLSEETASNLRNGYAVYPASSASSSNYGSPTLSVILPNTFDITGKGDTYSPVPMIAVNDAGKNILFFRHVGGLVRITCGSVPKGTRTVKVTVDKTITGTFDVENPSSTEPRITTPGTATNNYVVFTVAGEGGLATAQSVTLNVPVPCGTYTTYRVETFTNAAGTGTPVTSAEVHQEHTFARHHGWMLPVENISMVLAVTGPASYFSASSANSQTYSVQSYRKADSGDTFVPWTAEFYSEDSVKISRPVWLTTFTESASSGSTAAASFTATVTANNDTALRSWAGCTEIGSNSSQSAATDLSMQDIYGNPIAQSTANCYVVSKPGWYKFPCVYGNALKNGATNESAYRTSHASDSPVKDTQSDNYFLTRFVNHQDAAITNPWLNNNAGVTVSSADIVWQDAENLVTSISYQSNYVYFYIDPENIKHGNALIAAKNSEGTILWSWHIWVIEGIEYMDWLTTTTVYANTTDFPLTYNIQYTFNSAATHIASNEMLNCNLGWYEAYLTNTPRTVLVKITQNVLGGKSAWFRIHQLSSGLDRPGSNTFYQWGRKDPFPGADVNAGNGIDVYSRDAVVYPNEGFGSGTKVPYNRTVNTLGYAIQKPNYFFYKTDAYAESSWCRPLDAVTVGENTVYKGVYNNLWNREGSFNEDVAVVKTIYDPCPVGFKVPNRNAFTGFRTIGVTSGTTNLNILGSWRHGFMFKRSPSDTEGIYFPSTSMREYGSGHLRPYTYGSSNTENSHHWTASRTPNTNGYIKDSGGNVTGYDLSKADHWNGIYFNFTNSASSPSTGDVEGYWAPDIYGFSVRPVRE